VGEKTHFSLFVIISEELIRKLISYSGELKVIKPDSLAKEIQKRASETLQRYSRTVEN
jgi:predicted DNA-binding transcriptional regulator YafY